MIEDLSTLIEKKRNAEAQVALQNVDPRWFADSKVVLLHSAVNSGNHTMVRYLLDNHQMISNECQNADSAPSSVVHSKSTEYYVNSRKSEIGPTVLHMAFILNDLKSAKILLEYNADVEAMCFFKRIPFFYYSQFDDSDLELEVLQIILERATSLTSSYLVDKMPIASLLRNGKKRALEVMFRSNLDLTARDAIGRNSLHYLAMNRVLCDWKDIINLLRDKHLDVDAIDLYQRNVLFYAAMHGSIDLLRFLVELNVDVLVMDALGFMPLHELFESKIDRSRKYECAKLLLQCAVDPQANDGETVFDIILGEGDFKLTKLILTHIVFNEARGVLITYPIQDQINSHRWLVNQYNLCKLQVNSLKKIQISEFTSLFQFLCESDEKKVLYLRNEKFYSSLESLRENLENKSEFFNICWGLMRKSLEKIQIRKNATEFLCEIMGFSYYRHCVIVDKILQYFTDKDFEFYKNRITI